MEFVNDTSEDVLKSNEYRDISKRLGVIEQSARDMITKARDNVATSEKISSQAIDLIRHHREEVRIMFNELEQNLITHVKTIASEDKQKMQDLENELADLSNTIEQLRSSEAENLVTSSPADKLYVQMRVLRDDVSVIEQKLSKTMRSNVIRLFSFDPNNDITNVSNGSGLGKIVIPNAEIEEIGKVIHEDIPTTRDTIETSMPDNCTGDKSVDDINALLSQLEDIDTPLVDSNAFNQLEHVIQDKSDKLETMRTYECMNDESSGSFGMEGEEKNLDIHTKLQSDSDMREIQENVIEETCPDHQDKQPDSEVRVEQSVSVDHGEASADVVFEGTPYLNDEQKNTCPETDFQFENQAIPSNDDDQLNMLTTEEEYANTDDDGKDQWKSGNTRDKKKYDRDFLLQFQFDPAATCRPEGLPDISDINLDKETHELYVQTKDILSKLTPLTFETVVSQMKTLPVDSEAKLLVVVDQIFKKAISGPKCSLACADISLNLSMLKVPDDSKPSDSVSFHDVLLKRCRREFETYMKKKPAEHHARKEDMMNEIELMADTQRFMGMIRFIGELFQLNIIGEKTMHDFVFQLLRKGDNEKLECACVLLTTIGKILDHDKAKPRMDQYFERLQKIVELKTRQPDLRSKLQAVIDLRLNRWAPHKEENLTAIALEKEKAMEACRRVGRIPPRCPPVRPEDITFGGGERPTAVNKTTPDVGFQFRRFAELGPRGGGFGRGRGGGFGGPCGGPVPNMRTTFEPLSGGAYGGGAFGSRKTLPNLRNTLENVSSKEIWVTLKKMIVIEKVENEAVFDWINTTVEEPHRVKHQFTRLLMKAICFGAIRGSRDDMRAVSENIIRRKDLLMTYITDKPDSELHALYALQALVTQLKHPPGVLRPMFDALHDNGVISEDVFLKWKRSEVEPDGKQVCLNELDQFFLMINFKRLIGADAKE